MTILLYIQYMVYPMSFRDQLIIVVGTTFVAQKIQDQTITGLIWSPFPSPTPALSHWVTHFSPLMSHCLSEFVWRYCHIQSATLLDELESVNVVNVLDDDSSGDLEMSPIGTALISSLVLLHSQRLGWTAEKSRVSIWTDLGSMD